jgi:adenylate cyclase
MYTDMVGYTALGQRNESLSLALVDEQRKLLRPIFNRHSGKEIKTMGDAFLVEFPSALDAVRCAYDIQRATREFNISLSDEKQVRLRVGVHLGDVVESQGDVLGDAVNVASRIQALAEEGGVCITEQVFDHVKNKLDVSLVSKGKMSLKNVSEPVEVYRMVMPWSEEKAAPPIQLDRRRIAILPFTSMSPDPNDEYFAEGMTEELISTMSRIRDLRVIARTSVMGYKGGQKKISDIAKELDVGTVLEGSVRKAGNRLRITVQLIDSLTSDHLWVESYDRELKDVFAIQSDISKTVAEALKVQLLTGDREKIEKEPTKNTEAYLLYLKGRQYWNKRSKDAVYRAKEYFQLAIDSDPDFALAHVGIADCWLVLESWGHASNAEVAPKAKQAVLRALKLDDKLAEAHATYAGELATNEWKWEEAELEFKRAIELNPNDATAHQWYSDSFLRFTSRLDEALEEAQKALELDPLAPVTSLVLGETLLYLEQYDKAMEYFEKALAIDSSFLVAYLMKAYCYLMSSRCDEGIELFETYQPKVTTETRAKLSLVLAYGIAGRTEDARRFFAEVEQAGDRDQVPLVELAWAYFGLGETDRMFEYLDRATLEKGVGVPYALISPFLKRYRSDPRFLAIKSKVGI